MIPAKTNNFPPRLAPASTAPLNFPSESKQTVPFPIKTPAAVLLATALLVPSLQAQSSSSSSSSSSSQPDTRLENKQQPLAPRPRVTQPEAGGAAVTLETSEPLFDL